MAEVEVAVVAVVVLERGKPKTGAREVVVLAKRREKLPVFVIVVSKVIVEVVTAVKVPAP